MNDREYFPTFAQLSSLLRVTQESINSKRKIAISGDLLKELIMRAIAHLEFDEKWYLSKYPDVKEAWEKGSEESILKLELNECLPSDVPGTPFENIFHRRNLHSIVEKKYFMPEKTAVF